MNHIQNLNYKYFLNHHYHILYDIYNNILKDYHSTLDLNTFISFAFNNTTQNVRLYQIKNNYD